MASAQENQEFVGSILSNYPLDDAIEYIKENINPEDVYDIDYLTKYIGYNFNLEDVFETKDLEEWALENGFVKEKNDE